MRRFSWAFGSTCVGRSRRLTWIGCSSLAVKFVSPLLSRQISPNLRQIQRFSTSVEFANFFTHLFAPIKSVHGEKSERGRLTILLTNLRSDNYRLCIIKPLSLVLSRVRLSWLSYHQGSSVRWEANTVQPTALGLLQIYETPSRRYFEWFAAIKIKRRSNAKEGANKHSLFPQLFMKE